MFTKELNEFMIRYKIPSAGKWAEVAGVSKTTVTRALNGEAKGMGVETLQRLLEPYNGGSIDDLLNFSPEKEEAKKKIENVLEVIENSDELPQEQTEEIKSSLEKVREHIDKEPNEHEKCVACATYREVVAELKQDKLTKDKWLVKLFGLSFLLLGIVFVLVVSTVVLAISLINAIH